jgi:septal ring-binding cell division protein DamX
VIDPASDVPQDSPLRRVSGATWAGLAFVAGTLFALLPMYYFYSGNAAAPRETAPPAVPADTVEPVNPAAAEGATGFAARMSYELSQTPEELPPRAAAATDAVPATTEAPPAAPRRSPAEIIDERPAGRIANARPISSTPPDPRDTTRGIESEARRAEYARPPTRPASQSQNAQGRVFEGRDLVIGPKSAVSTRPIGAAVSRQGEEIDAPGRVSTVTVVGNGERAASDAAARPAPPVTGVSPIGPAPQAPERSEPPRKGGSAGEALNSSASDVESRLAATREWLSAAPQTLHTIQIMGTNSEDQLKSQLRALARVLEPQKIYVFRTVAHGKPVMTVVYGGYADRQSALQALEKLPPSVSANRPVLRTVNGIRSELRQHGIPRES